MAATYNWGEDNGASTGSPAHGTTRSGIGNATYATDVNWKNSDDCTNNSGNAYSAKPINGGNNSYQKNTYGIFSGTFDSILAGTGVAYFAHITTAFGTGLTLMGVGACTSDGTRYLYVTPSTATDANLTTNMTTAIAITSGVAVSVGATGPEATGKGASSTANPCYTNYLTTQLQTTSSAAAGDTAQVTLEVEYQEN